MGENQTESERRPADGVGITAEGDMLAALGLRYGSEEAIDFAVDIQKTLAVEAYRASVHLAKDRGSFKIYDTRREENKPFLKALTRSRIPICMPKW